MGEVVKKKTDRRVLYTKMVLRESLLELMREKPVDKITPTELCRRADINRNTFYSHYYTPRDILDEIENEFSEQLLTVISEKIDTSDTENLLVEICRMIYDKREFTEILLSENGDSAFLKAAITQCSDYILKGWRERGITIEGDALDLYFAFTIEGSLAILRKWAAMDFRISPEQIAGLINKATSGSLSAM